MLCLVFNLELAEEDCKLLLELDGVSSILVPKGVCEGVERVGTLHSNGSWTLPDPKPNILFFVNTSAVYLMGWRRILSAISNNIYTFKDICTFKETKSGFSYKRINALNLLFGYIYSKLIVFFNKTNHSNVNQVLQSLKLADFNKKDIEFTSNITLLNRSLASGGSERQVVNTIKGLSLKHKSLKLWCDNLGNDYFKFYLKSIPSNVSVLTTSDIALLFNYKILFENDESLNLQFLKLKPSLDLLINVLPLHLL